MRTLGRRLHLSFTVYQDASLDALDALLPKSVVDTYSDTKRKRKKNASANGSNTQALQGGSI